MGQQANKRKAQKQRKRSVPKSPKSVPKKKSKKRPKKISKTKPKKKRAIKKSKSSIGKKSATIRKSTAKKKHETKKSSEMLISTGKPLVDEHFEQAKSHEVYCEDSVYDAMLNMRNAEKNIDKFYILQVLKSTKGFVFHTRWGRTGTKGQIKTLGPFKDHKLAVEQFEKKFKAKTGVSWLAKASLLGKANPNTKKYSVLRVNYAPPSNGVIWQYFVDDGVGGKTIRWMEVLRWRKSGNNIKQILVPILGLDMYRLDSGSTRLTFEKWSRQILGIMLENGVVFADSLDN